MSGSSSGRLRVVTKSYKNQLNQSYSNTLGYRWKLGVIHLLKDSMQKKRWWASCPEKKNGLLVFKNSRVIFSLCQVGVVPAPRSCQQQRAAIAVIESHPRLRWGSFVTAGQFISDTELPHQRWITFGSFSAPKNCKEMSGSLERFLNNGHSQHNQFHSRL